MGSIPVDDRSCSASYNRSDILAKAPGCVTALWERALGLGPAGLASNWSEAVVSGKGQEPCVVNRHTVLVGCHDDFHVVVQAGCRHTA